MTPTQRIRRLGRKRGRPTVAKQPAQDGARLQRAFDVLGWRRPVPEVAARTGMSQWTLSQILGGKRSLGREDLRALAKIGIPADYLLGAAEKFTPPGEARPAMPVAPGAQRHVEREDGLVKEAMGGLFKALPMQQHLVYEYRGLSAVAIKVALALQAHSQSDPAGAFRAAGRLLGKCIAAPVQILGLGAFDIPLELPGPGRDQGHGAESRIAQAYVSAMAHAVEILAHYARPVTSKPRKPRRPAKRRRK